MDYPAIISIPDVRPNLTEAQIQEVLADLTPEMEQVLTHLEWDAYQAMMQASYSDMSPTEFAIKKAKFQGQLDIISYLKSARS